MSIQPDSWRQVTIDDVLAPLEDGRTIHQGWSPQCEKEPSDNDSDWGVLKTTAIQPGDFQPGHNKRLPVILAPRPLLEVREGDVIVTSAGPRARCGVAALVRRTRPHLMLSGKMYRFRFDEGLVDPRFGEAYLLSDTAARAIDGMKTGISDSGLNLTHARFRKLTFPLPPLVEQQRIVAAIEEQFSRLDAAEDLLARADRGLSRMEAASLTALGARPWPVRPLREYLTEPLRNGHSAKVAPAGQDGVRTLTLTAVTARDFSEANTKITVASPSRVKDLWLKPGDILIERSNTAELVGSASLFDGKPDWAIFPDLMIRARVGGDLLPRFLDLVLRTPEVRRYFRQKAQGISSSMPKISQTTIETLPIPVPPVTVQEEIVSAEESLSSIMASLRKSLNTTRRRATGLRSVVLRDAFVGRLLLQRSAHSRQPRGPERVRA
jgi:type I restriction enzyme, S subunit